MRKDPLVTGMYYHIYNRGVDKRDIFVHKKDLERFVLSLKEFNDVTPIGSIKEKLLLKNSEVEPPNREPLVFIVVFCLNPNHFHFIVKQEIDGGISEFFRRLSGGYTYYFNLVHKRNGALFQGRFKSKLIQDDEYFLKIRPYAHMNHLMHEIPENKKHLIYSSEKEYDDNKFDIVSEKEAKELLEFYGSNENFKKECISVIDMIREERGLVSLQDEDLLP